jgi:SAM-dependent methyltransferase
MGWKEDLAKKETYMLNVKRSCPCCNSKERKSIYSQVFESFSEGSLLSGYEIVSCDSCGMVFADNIPEQYVFDKYYSEMSKYESPNHKAGVEIKDVEIYKKIVDFLAPYFDLSYSIADVGCATGVLLHEFKKQGFTKLTGLDPSEVCCEIGAELYGLEMRRTTINQLTTFAERYDVVMATGVLEHLCDIKASLAALKSILKPDGKLFLAVPDASQYDKHFGAPFQYFSMEHINFFGPDSLANLMSRHGFKTEAIQRFDRYLGSESIEPIVMALFSPDTDEATNPPLKYDEATGMGIKRYIQNSKVLEERIHAQIDEIVNSQVPLMVWAVGTHTLRLLKTSSLAEANIIAFIDSNKNYQGKTLKGYPILAPEEARGINAEILISSQVAEGDIRDSLVNSLKWTGRIHTLYS